MSFHKLLRGLDLHAPTNELVENNSTQTIQKMKVVSLDGMGAVYPQVKITTSVSDTILGVATEDIEPGSNGIVCALGFLFNVDTSSWFVNSVLYSDSNGNLSTTPNGTPVGIVIKSHISFGVLYIFASVGLLNTDNNWTLQGNSSINPLIHFIGTTDNNPFIIKTNNVQRSKITELGRIGLGNIEPERHIHIKTHPNFSGSGLQLETISFNSSSNVYETIYSVQVPDPAVIRLCVDVHARQSDGSNRASFKRTGFFYRQGSNVIAPELWQSDYTQKSNNYFNIRYILIGDTIEVQVRNAAPQLTYWTGNITLEKLQSST